MTDIGTTVEKEHKKLPEFKLGCDDCSYLTFDAIIKDEKRALIGNLPTPGDIDKIYTTSLQYVLKRIGSNIHGIVGIFDSVEGHHIIADLYNGHVKTIENDDNTGCDSITEMKKRMNEIAKPYEDKHKNVQQVLITDKTTPCCEKRAKEVGNFHEVYDLYAK